MYLQLSLLSLLSAFLLFQVQPVISKFILPWFGGSPGVWTTCMLFFQIVLFAGYAYAHALTKLRPRTQFLIHGVLMLGALICLPIAPGDSWKPAGDEDPMGRILLLLLGTVGLPYFVLSSTSPLTQVWFTRALPGSSPWRLYALSNLGSLAALLSYPFLFEPRWDVLEQTWYWSGGFILFAALSLWMAWSTAPKGTVTESEAVADEGEAPRWWQRVLWLLLPAVASAMLLATTNHVCQDVAVVPFMWVVPLSLYLITFIICFEHERWYLRPVWTLLALAVVFVTIAEKKITLEVTPNYLAEIAWSFGAMFLACMVCHGELARLKPAPSRLTEFYLLMSAGGAVGGLLVSLVAPRVFVTYLEWPLGLITVFAIALLALMAALLQGSWRQLCVRLGLFVCTLLLIQYALGFVPEKVSPKWLSWLPAFSHGVLDLRDELGQALKMELKQLPGVIRTAYKVSAWKTVGSLGCLLIGFAALFWRLPRRRLHLVICIPVVWIGGVGIWHANHWSLTVDERLERVRNFYGAVNVDEDWDTGLESSYRTLTHGGIVHGMQNLGVLLRDQPVTYYGHESGIGRSLDTLKDRPEARVGIVGMGAGTTACYARKGQHWSFYEINPEISRLARKHFTYLADAETRGATVETILGDARLMLEREPDQKLDVLLLDAFSGDAIPVHLLTKEAFAIYRRHMKPDGIIVVHVTNRYLALAPVVEKLAADIGWKTTRVLTEEDGDLDITDYVMVTTNEAFLKDNPPDEPEDPEPKDVPLWTDRRHDLFQILLTD
jgi:SAM-dependent methyltransferase